MLPYSSIREINYRYIGWFIWGCSSLFYLYQFILRISTGVMAHDIMLDLHITQAEFGLVAGGYYLTYSLMQIPLGLLSDQYDTRKILMVSIFSCILGTICLSYATSMMEAYLGRLLIGFGSSAAFLTCIKNITIWFPPSYLPILVGLTVALGTLGANIGGKSLALLSNYLGWRYTFFSLSLLGVGVLCLSGSLFFKNYNKTPAFHARKPDLTLNNKKGLPQYLLVSPQAWLIAGLYFLTYAPLSCIADTWGVSYLVEVYGLSQVKSAEICLMIYMGVAIGSPVMGYLSNKLCSRRIVLIFSTLLSSFTFLYIFYVPGVPPEFMKALFFLFGLFLGGQKLAFTCICELMPKAVSGTAIGFINSICMLSGALLPALMGECLVLSSNSPSINCFKTVTAGDYAYAFLIPGFCLTMGFVVSFFVKETYSLPSKQKPEIDSNNILSSFR